MDGNRSIDAALKAISKPKPKPKPEPEPAPVTPIPSDITPPTAPVAAEAPCIHCGETFPLAMLYDSGECDRCINPDDADDDESTAAAPPEPECAPNTNPAALTEAHAAEPDEDEPPEPGTPPFPGNPCHWPYLATRDVRQDISNLRSHIGILEHIAEHRPDTDKAQLAEDITALITRLQTIVDDLTT